VYYTLAMIVFFQSNYSQVWVKLVGGLDWAKTFRDRVEAGCLRRRLRSPRRAGGWVGR